MLKKLRAKLNANDPLMIQNYIGYASPSSIYLKGRILENEGVSKKKTEGAIKNLIQNFKRFETDEVPGVQVEISVKNKKWDLITDREGYFTLDAKWDYVHEDAANWLSATVKMKDLSEEADIFYASPSAKFGVITDIDDTVLQTNVNSLFKLRMLYATFFQGSHQRLPMEGIVDLFNKFAEGSNPIFYISHSPWNIHDVLVDFMEVQKLPKGPILLRDYGINPTGHFHNHKSESIKRILSNHPDLPFVMLGDTAAEDADFYIDLAHEFSGQISAIYIRQTKDNKNARRIKQLVEEHSHHQTDVILSESSHAMAEHARANGYIT
jgi:phosphatidate phosphatase APP1